MRRKYVLGSLLPALWLATQSWTLLAQSHQPMTDAQIQAIVEHELEDEKLLRGRVSVSVENRMVELRGKVPSIWAKQRAVELAFDVPDVDSVKAELEIARAESDEALASEIAQKIRFYAFYTIYDDVELSVDQGVVTLLGRVTMPYKAEEMAQMAGRVLGAQEVRNEIQTLPVSIHDSRLRIALARRIYGDSLFYEYAFRPDPPIHIVVENGNVTLSGAVRSEVERRKAEHIVRSTFGVFRVENRLRVDS